MQISKALRIYFIKVIMPGFAIAITVGFIFGWIAHFILKYLGTLKTEYQYELILPSFVVIGIAIWAIIITKDLCFIIKNKEHIEKNPDESR